MHLAGGGGGGGGVGLLHVAPEKAMMATVMVSMPLKAVTSMASSVPLLLPHGG